MSDTVEVELLYASQDLKEEIIDLRSGEMSLLLCECAEDELVECHSRKRRMRDDRLLCIAAHAHVREHVRVKKGANHR